MIRINQLKVPPEKWQQKEHILRIKAAKQLRIPEADILEMQIVRESVDARKKPDIFYIYTVDVAVRHEKKVLQAIRDKNVTKAQQINYVFPHPEGWELALKNEQRPVIIGTGPAGLFCGYLLAKHGYRPLLLERGADAEQRTRDVQMFWEQGILNPESNVQFGEGGAGTFSDGKLNTLVKDADGRNREVLRIFVENGAQEQILYDSRPHIGTDILRRVVQNIRQKIISWGGEVRFHTKVTGLSVKNGMIEGVDCYGQHVACRTVVLACGHSARDTFEMLYELGITMEAKAFAVGFRVEHPQTKINLAQYGVKNPAFLPPAPYKVTAKASDGRGVYSFCMCPGGYVLNASSEPGRLAVNGMSYADRSGQNANSAVIVQVRPEDFGSGHPLAGIAFQRRIEEMAFRQGQGNIPVECLGDFRTRRQDMRDKLMQGNDRQCDILPCTKGKVTYADLRPILPEELNQAFLEGMEQFDRVIPGFAEDDVVLSGVESRTSSPVRIMRDDKLQSSIRGLYPCGEGAGYAGGITSAAMDGMRVAEAVAAAIQRQAEEGSVKN